MATTAQILSNQQNAQHSTGPRTPSGKQASSLNSTRHGLTSQLVLLPGEDAVPYEAFRAKLLTELAPEGTVEQMLAQTICDTQWRLERARRNEANILALPNFEELPEAIGAIEDPAERAAMIEAYACTKYERALHNIQLHEGRLGRGLSKALDDFRATQQLRRDALDTQMTEAINTRNRYLAIERPFEPADFGFVFTIAEIDRQNERRHIHFDPANPNGVPHVETKTENQARRAQTLNEFRHAAAR